MTHECLKVQSRGLLRGEARSYVRVIFPEQPGRGAKKPVIAQSRILVQLASVTTLGSHLLAGRPACGGRLSPQPPSLSSGPSKLASGGGSDV